MSSFTLPEPREAQPYMEVSALEAGNLQLILTKFLTGARPGESTFCPSLAFSLRHSVTKAHLVFDLGIRRDMDVHPPAVQKNIAGRVIVTPQSVDESLQKGGIDPVDVKTIIVSHLHYDQYVRLMRVQLSLTMDAAWATPLYFQTPLSLWAATRRSSSDNMSTP